jgi:hypothetical protein
MATLATSATLAGSAHKIKDGEPGSFANRIQVLLQLEYRINDAGKYEFRYRTAAKPATWDQKALSREVEQVKWKPFLEKAAFESSLDIGIAGADTLVYVETVGSHFFWSVTRDALTTAEDHSDLYGELRYLDGDEWVKREDFDKHFCRLMRFKAKFNAAGAKGESHKFSYNVLLRDRFGDMVEYEIDPDIKNPSV